MADQKQIERFKMLLEEIVEDAKEDFPEFAKIKEWKTVKEWEDGSVDAVNFLAKIVEFGLISKTLIGSITEEEMITYISEFLDTLLALPFYLEPWDGVLFKILIHMALEFYKKTFGSAKIEVSKVVKYQALSDKVRLIIQ